MKKVLLFLLLVLSAKSGAEVDAEGRHYERVYTGTEDTLCSSQVKAVVPRALKTPAFLDSLKAGGWISPGDAFRLKEENDGLWRELRVLQQDNEALRRALEDYQKRLEEAESRKEVQRKIIIIPPQEGLLKPFRTLRIINRKEEER